METIAIYNKKDLYKFLIENNNKSNTFYKESFFKKMFPDFYDKIISFHKKYHCDNFMFSQKIYNYIFDIKQIPHCDECGKTVKFKSFGYGYCKYCSLKCSYNSTDRNIQISTSHKSRTDYDIQKSNKKRKDTCLKKYNVISVSQCESIKKKQMETRANRSEEERLSTKNKVIQKWKNKTEDELNSIIRKRAETNSKKTEEERKLSYKKSLVTRISHYGDLETSYKIGIEKAKKKKK